MQSPNLEQVKEAAEAQIRATVREQEAYRSPYERWKESQGLLTVRGFQVDDVYTVDLTPWEARGGSGVFINLDGTDGFNDSYVYELAPRESSRPVRHIYDELIFILTGQGACTVWADEDHKQTFEWGSNSFFALPPNARHQFHNLSGTEPARYFAMTTAPRIIDAFQNLDFIFNNPYRFTDRFNGEEGYFKETRDRFSGVRWATNFIADVTKPRAHRSTAGEIEARARAGIMNQRGGVGGGGGEGESSGYGGRLSFVNSTVRCGYSLGSQPGVHTMAHRHGPGIHVLTIGGQGYTLLWSEDVEPIRANAIRVEWGPGTVFVPPERWWHAHFSTGPGAHDWLRMGWGTDKPKPGGRQYVYTSLKEGGDQIAFDEEDPAIHREWEEELAKMGVTCLMLHHPCCTRT